MTTPEHDQPDHEGMFPANKRRTSKKLRLQYGYCEYKMKALLIKMGLCDVLVWLLNTNEVREVTIRQTFNLNKTQSLNNALRDVYCGTLIRWEHGAFARQPRITPDARQVHDMEFQVQENSSNTCVYDYITDEYNLLA